jgi:ABC-2 type transport system ATP-binding protein
MSGALVAEGLHYRYRRRDADVLAGLDWTIAPGSRTLLLGPPGSGKSTLLRLLALAGRPRKGRVHLADGGDPRRSVGWLPQQQPRGVAGLSVAEQIAYVGWLKGLSRAEAAARATQHLERVGLKKQATQTAVALTPAQRPRLALAEALAYRARFLFLDEPTGDLQPTDRDKFWNILGKIPRELSIVVSSAEPHDAARNVDAVAVLDAGAWRFTGTREQFLARGLAVRSTSPGKQSPEKRAAAAAYRAVLA